MVDLHTNYVILEPGRTADHLMIPIFLWSSDKSFLRTPSFTNSSSLSRLRSDHDVIKSNAVQSRMELLVRGAECHFLEMCLDSFKVKWTWSRHFSASSPFLMSENGLLGCRIIGSTSRLDPVDELLFSL
jgi:hypothetical protein